MRQVLSAEARTLIAAELVFGANHPQAFLPADFGLLDFDFFARNTAATGSAGAASVRTTDAKPTIVLVHGAFASPAAWDRVAAALHKDGQI